MSGEVNSRLDEAEIFGATIGRPAGVSRSRWLEFWERVTVIQERMGLHGRDGEDRRLRELRRRRGG